MSPPTEPVPTSIEEAPSTSKLLEPIDPPIYERLEKRFREMLEHKSRYLSTSQPNRAQLEEWLSNFEGKVFPEPAERLLALYLLSCFVDLSDREVRYLCRLLFRRFITEELDRAGKHDGGDLQGATRTILAQTRFYPIGPPGKSGAHILYLFRLENSLPDELFLNPLHDRIKIPRVCFVDDALLTGEQADAYKADADKIPSTERVLLTLVATEAAIKRMQKNGFRVVCALLLTPEEVAFGPHTPQLCNLTDDMEGICTKDDLITFCKTYGELALSDRPLGHGDCALLLGFDHNVPDNTLPIFWAPEPWVPVKQRRQPEEDFRDDRTFV